MRERFIYFGLNDATRLEDLCRIRSLLLPGTLLKAAEDARLWVYASANFQVDASTDKLLALLKRAKAAGGIITIQSIGGTPK